MKSTLSLRGRWICLLLSGSFSLFAQAQKTPQQVEDLRRRLAGNAKIQSFELSEERQTPSLIRLKSGQGVPAAEAKTTLSGLLGLRAGTDELREVRRVASAGMEVVEYHQYYKGIRVEHARYTALVKGGRAEVFNGAFYEVPATLKLQPSLQKEGALEKAKSSVGARKWAWENAEEIYSRVKEAGQKAALLLELREYLPEGELVVVKDFTASGVARMRLAYKFNIYAVQPVSRAWIYVDAETGKLLLRDAIIKHVEDGPSATSVSVTVPTRYAGNRTVKTKQISGNDPNSGLPLTSSNPLEVYVPGSATYGLLDDTRGGGIETYDLNGVGGLPINFAPAYAQGKSFTDKDNNWTLAEHRRSGPAESENDDIAFDAHWGASVVYDYWKDKHARLSFDGKNGKIKSFIHSGFGYDNAFWNGTVMTYGDGSYPAPGGFRPLTSLDVCGHEIGHGVCSFTSDLVYAKESGAMNEALSDIWAACVEYYAIRRVDPALASRYKPFYIGEQISADPAAPLRRMDDPKSAGNPDTYGGTNWTSQVGCTPTLANDQCGVHNNSGVLNKWFYLLTVGSGAGSGPDRAYVGADDGVNDLGNAYSVTGLGFDAAEKITYLMELMLTSTATFAEARQVSIAVATELSGNPCSAMVESVTNAWYAVGVGAKFVKPCSVTFGFINRSDISVTESAATAGCTAQKSLTIPVFIPANATVNISTSGSAYVARDFTIAPYQLSNTTTAPRKATFSVNILNDGGVEATETIVLKLKISNTGGNAVDSVLTVSILDDDVVPIIGNGEKSLLNETFTRANGFTDPTGWKEILEIAETTGDPLATGKNQWGIFDNKLAITGKEGLTNTQLPNGTYNSASESRTLVRTPLIDARGLSLVTVSFAYLVQGEVDPATLDPENFPAFDYMAVAYSTDGVNFIELNTGDFRQFASALPVSGTFTGTLPASLANKQFYLAFRWNNDANAGGPQSVTIDNFTVKGATRKIESDAVHGGSEKIDPYGSAYFYSTQDGQVVGYLQNNSASNFGCTNVTVEKAGNATFNLYQDATHQHKVSDKVVRIAPAGSFTASTVVTLYFTEAQLKALEQATGTARTSFRVYKVNAAGYAGATSANTVRYTPVYTAIPGAGGSFRVSFTAAASGSYALGAAVAPAVTGAAISRDFPEAAAAWRFHSIYPNPGTGTVFLNIDAPQAQRVRVEVVNVAGQLVYQQIRQLQPGTTSIALPARKFGTGSYRVQVKNDQGETLNSQQLLRQ